MRLTWDRRRAKELAQLLAQGSILAGKSSTVFFRLRGPGLELIRAFSATLANFAAVAVGYSCKFAPQAMFLDKRMTVSI